MHFVMDTFFGMLFGAAIMVGMGSSGAVAQTAAPTYKGDPSVYKVIFEDDNFRAALDPFGYGKSPGCCLGFFFWVAS